MSYTIFYSRERFWGIKQVQSILLEGFERLNYSTKRRGVQRVKPIEN